ncbi:MAG: radical SAM protein [Myxococcota bacterium]|nr:radical SAM protein [Myxococcota bacterium]
MNASQSLPTAIKNTSKRIFLSNHVGCELTSHEGLEVKAYLRQNGHQLVNDHTDAEYLIVNTCAFIHSQRKRLRERLRVLEEGAPSAKLIVMGCAKDIAPDIFENSKPMMMLGHDDLHRLDKIFAEEKPFAQSARPHWNPDFQRVVISLGRGCAQFCSFCSIKKSIGNMKSRPIRDIVDDIKLCLSEGHDRFLLSGDDVGCYGVDCGKSLNDLLQAVSSLEGKMNILLGNVHPLFFMKNYAGIRDFLNSPNSSKWFFLSMQSASNKVLFDMKRNHGIEEVRLGLARLQEDVPGLKLNYDIIVGFPTESEKAFNATLKFLKEFPPHAITISPYSHESGTSATEYTELPKVLVQERLNWAYAIYGSALQKKGLRVETWGDEVDMLNLKSTTLKILP